MSHAIPKYIAGPIVTVGALEVDDYIFLTERRQQIGLPTPEGLARVTELVPSTNGTVLVTVVNPGSGAGVPPRILGYLGLRLEFRSAVLDA